MTRGRVTLELLKDEKARNTTFSKRKNGLFKKVLELSILCDCEIGIVIFNHNGKLVEYSSKGSESLLELIRRWGAYTGSVESKSNVTALQPSAGRYEQRCPRWTVQPVPPASESARVRQNQGSPRAPGLIRRSSARTTATSAAAELSQRSSSLSLAQDPILGRELGDDQLSDYETLRKMCAEAEMMQDIRRQYELYRERVLRWSGKRQKSAFRALQSSSGSKRERLDSEGDESSSAPSGNLADFLKSDDARRSDELGTEATSPGARRKRFRPEALSIDVDPLTVSLVGQNSDKLSTAAWEPTVGRPSLFTGEDAFRNGTPSANFPEASSSGRIYGAEASPAPNAYSSTAVGTQLSPRLAYRSLMASYPMLVSSSPATGVGMSGVIMPTPTGATGRNIANMVHGASGAGSAADASGVSAALGPLTQSRTQPAMLSPTALIYEQIGLSTPREAGSWSGYSGAWLSFVGTGSTPRMGTYAERGNTPGNAVVPSQPSLSAPSEAETNALDSPAGT
ncbi:hypothetical protein CCYA_CCYA20G4786 [Cyanidiococcus yangmingshanensis]|nr:hypothetical protein CCYA_CCYA20G4786 [Cyanidiococcus yangmingshanensis]